jgi:hypothetical protein
VYERVQESSREFKSSREFEREQEEGNTELEFGERDHFDEGNASAVEVNKAQRGMVVQE